MVAQLQGDRRPPDQRFLETLVAEVRHPPAPRRGGGLQHGLGVETMMAMGAAPGQHHVQGIALLEVVGAVEATQRAAGPQVELEVRPPRGVQPQATGCHPRLGTAARFQLNPEPHVPVQDRRRPDQFAPAPGNIIGQVSAGTQREGIGEPDQAGRAAQLGDQDAGVRLVVLPGLRQLVRGECEMTAAFPVQQGAEDRFGVEAGKAQPLDAAIQADQGHGCPVSDQPEILKWRVTVADPDGPERRIRLEHDADAPSPMSAPKGQYRPDST